MSWVVEAFDKKGKSFLFRPNLDNEKEIGKLIAEVLTYEREGGTGGITVTPATQSFRTSNISHAALPRSENSSFEDEGNAETPHS